MAIYAIQGARGGRMPDDYARQGSNPDATLTDTQAYAKQAATDAAAAKTAAQSLTSLDSDINAGKTAIAQAVTAKGVPTSPTDTMLQMATNVTQIAQAPISINGGEMYAKQLYGSLTTPNYWNLYEVMAQLLSDGRLNNYGGILLAEYYKGYDSLALSGAGAGGAYVVSDVDSNGNFILYTEDTTHVWDTKDDGKGNRWVAYCFNDAGHDFDITDTNTSPRSIHIGRHVGTISSLVDGRVSDIVVADDNVLDDFDTSGHTQNWGKCVCVRGIDNIAGSLIYNATSELLFVEVNSGVGTIFESAINSALVCAIIRTVSPNNLCIFSTTQGRIISITALYIDGMMSGKLRIENSTGVTGGVTEFRNLQEVIITNWESGEIEFWPYENQAYYPNALKRVFLGYGENDSTKSCKLSKSAWSIPGDCELKNKWCKSLDISALTSLTEANMYAHILQRLKQDEPDCGDGVTITLGQTNLDKLTSQESVDLLDSLTNTYGYTFA